MMIWQTIRDPATHSHKVMQKTVINAAIPKTKMQRNVTSNHTTKPLCTAFTFLKISTADDTSINNFHEHSTQHKSTPSAVQCTDAVITVTTHNFPVFVPMWLTSTFHSLQLLKPDTYEPDTNIFS
jgi:hypothetical protein